MNVISIPKIKIPLFIANFIKNNVGTFLMDRVGSFIDETISKNVFESSEKENKKEFEKQVRNASVQLEVQNIEAVIQQAMRVYDASFAILKDISQTKNGYINITIYGDINIYYYNSEKKSFSNVVDSALTNKIVDNVMHDFYDIVPQKEQIKELKNSYKPKNTEACEDTKQNNLTISSPKLTMREQSNQIWKKQMEAIKLLRSED